MANNRGTLGGGTGGAAGTKQLPLGSGGGTGGARPHSPRNSPLGSRPVHSNNTPGSGPPVYRQCGPSAPGGPPPTTNPGMNGGSMAQGMAPQRDARSKPQPGPQGASFVAPPSGVQQSSGSFGPPQQNGSFAAAPQHTPAQAPRRGGQASGPAPFACIIRRAA